MMAGADLSGSVLIVEDTPASLTLLSSLLRSAGYAVREAPNGELALWSAESSPPDLILLDVRMPGIDGFAVCERLKQSPALRDIPVIFLSAQSDTDDKIRGFQAGAIDFIAKPYQPEEVLARAGAHMALARSQRALAATNAALGGALAQLQATREELQRAERLAALGSLVAGVAHELNTPIGNCLLAASTLGARTQAFDKAAAIGIRRSDLQGFIDDAQQASGLLLRNLNAAARLIDNFKHLATDQAASLRRRFSLQEPLVEVAHSLGAALRGAGVRLQQADGTGIELDSYPTVLFQVLHQLVANALLHGVCDGGRIAIDAAQADGWLTLTVTDDGSGIAQDALPRVFEPFFTTRLGQGSSGLGLHIVHNLVTNVLGGRIEAASTPGCTRFTLHCPLVTPILGRERPHEHPAG